MYKMGFIYNMYYTNSRWKRFKNGFVNSHMKGYLVILLVLVVVIAITIKNSGLIANMLQTETASQENNESESGVEQSSEPYSYAEMANSHKILVNKSNNFITIYTVNSSNEVIEAVKTFRCSVNPSVEVGEYETFEKNIWRNLNNAGFGQYTTRIGSNCYIHSVPYYSQNSNALNVQAYNNLGNPANVGYIYLASADAKWIYENCSIGSVVKIYEDDSETPAIELEEFSKSSRTDGYDPTDTTANIKAIDTKINYMTGVSDHSVRLGTNYNVWDGVYAVDVNNNDITDKITITGTVNTTVAGTYTIVYHLKDNYGTDLAYYSYVTVY